MPLTVFGHESVVPGIKKIHSAIADLSERNADCFLQVLGAVATYGIKENMLRRSFVGEVDKVYHSDLSGKIWMPEHIAALSAVASQELQLAMSVGLYTGQRQKDYRELTWNNYDATAIELTHSKGGREVYIPSVTPLNRVLDSQERRAVQILTTTHGTPWTESGFQSSWGKATRRAGIGGLTFHVLRGTIVKLLSEAGCTVP